MQYCRPCCDHTTWRRRYWQRSTITCISEYFIWTGVVLIGPKLKMNELLQSFIFNFWVQCIRTTLKGGIRMDCLQLVTNLCKGFMSLDGSCVWSISQLIPAQRTAMAVTVKVCSFSAFITVKTVRDRGCCALRTASAFPQLPLYNGARVHYTSRHVFAKQW